MWLLWGCREMRQATCFRIAMTKADGVWHANYDSNCSVFKLVEKCPNVEPAPQRRGGSQLSAAAVPWQDKHRRLREREDETLRITSGIRSTSQMINKLLKFISHGMLLSSQLCWVKSCTPQFSVGIICHFSVNLNIGKGSLYHLRSLMQNLSHKYSGERRWPWEHLILTWGQKLPDLEWHL